MPATRASELGLALADAFEADGRMDHHILRIVVWRLEAGAEPSAEVLLDASNRAAERNDWDMSRRLASAAVAADGGSEAACALADALRALGRYTEALEVLGNHQGEGDDQVARMAVLRAFILASGLGRYDEADAALARAAGSHRATFPSGPGSRPSGPACSPSPAARSRRWLGPSRLLDRAICSRARRWRRGRRWLPVCRGAGWVDQAVGAADSCHDEAYASAGERLSISWSQLARAVSYLQAGRIFEMEQRAQAQHQLAVQLNDRHGQGGAAAALGWVALPRGQITTAISRFRESIAALESADPLGTRTHAMCGLIEALALSGERRDAAAAVLAEAQRAAGNEAGVSSAWPYRRRGLPPLKGTWGGPSRSSGSPGNRLGPRICSRSS